MALFGQSDKVKFKKLKQEGCTAAILVEVPAVQAEEESHSALLRLQERAAIPGFRQGKAPLDILKKQFEGRIREDVIARLARKHIPAALSELRLSPVAAPVITRVELAPSKPLRLEVEVELSPEIEPKGYSGMALSRRDYPAADADVDKRLSELREANARLERASHETVKSEHYVVTDLSASRGGKPLPRLQMESELVDVSSEQSLPGLAAALVGMSRGESKEVATTIEGREAVLKVTVKEIKEKILPPLDDEFAKDIGVPTLAELKEKIKEVLGEEGRRRAESEIERQIDEALLKANKVSLPPSLVERELSHRLERLRARLLGPRGQWPEKDLAAWAEKLKPDAEKDLKLSFILQAVARKENISVAPEDLSKEMETSLAAARTPDKQDEVRRLFEERKAEMTALIKERKVLSFIKEKAAYKE